MYEDIPKEGEKITMNDLVAKARKKDVEAFGKLIQSQSQSLYKIASAILLNDEDAADAVQETILISWQKIGQLKDDKLFKTWLTRILINECYKMIRNGRRIEYMDTIEEQLAEPEGDVIRSLIWKEALATVDEKYRLILILFYAEGFSGKEIAKLLKLPHATVRTRLSRGREQLKQYYLEGSSDGERRG